MSTHQAAAAKPAEDEHKLPEREKAEAFFVAPAPPNPPPGYPKLKFHAVYSGVEVKDPIEEAKLGPGWFDSPELADASRTYADAELVRLNALQASLKTAIGDKQHHIVANSAQAEEATRRAQAGQS